MSELVAMIQHMRAKGIACHVILEAVEALASAKEDALEERRANDRVRKARSRAAQRETLKSQELRHVTPEDSADSADIVTETPAPLFSPLLPSPKPLTNNPPIIPPSSEKPSVDTRKREPNGTRLEADWSLTGELLEEAVKAQPANQLQLSEAEIRHEADKFRDYWHGQPGAKGRKLDWVGTWRNWIRRAAPEILRARSRAGGPTAPRRAPNAPQYAPPVPLFDAFALVGAEASDSWADERRSADHGTGSRAPSGPPRLEVIDSIDARATEARRSEGDRGHLGSVVLTLPIASVG